MDSSSLWTAVATVVAIGVGFYLYRAMGCSTSSVQPEKKESSVKSESVKAPVKEEKKYPGGKLFIFFGSQTGTAEGYSRTIMEEGKDAGFDAKMVDLEEFDPDMLKECGLALFLLATYGEGEPTDNSARFFKWLKDEGGEVPEAFLAKVHFSVFGLGNKQYEHFNRMGKLANSLLEKMGARRVFEYGQGDDDATMEEDFEAWKGKLWPALVDKFVSGSAAETSVRSAASDAVCSHKVSLHFQLTPTSANPVAAGAAAASAAANAKHVHTSSRHFFTAPRVPVVAARELRQVSSAGRGSTKHIDFDLSAAGLAYETADNLAVLPENPRAVVDAVAAKLHYNLDEVVAMGPVEGAEEEYKAVYPTPCSVRELLTCYADVQGELKQGVLRALAFYLSAAEQRAWWEKMLRHEHRAELKASLRLRTFAGLLADGGELSSLQIPLADLLHILPPMQPRYYTISSSALAQPRTVSVTVSLAEAALPSGAAFTGLCSGYLCAMAAGQSSARVFVRASTFRLPKSISTPLVLVGPGTGMAPMHAFLQERRHLLATRPELRAQAGPIALFFGCRHAEADWIYKDELLQMSRDGSLPFLYLAFSRDASASHDGRDADDALVAKSKVYVQQLLQEPPVARRLVQWLNVPADGRVTSDADAHVYVCGATNMGHDVQAAVQKILADAGCADTAAAIQTLHQRGRFVQELWSA